LVNKVLSGNPSRISADNEAISGGFAAAGGNIGKRQPDGANASDLLIRRCLESPIMPLIQPPFERAATRDRTEVKKEGYLGCRR